MRVLILGGGLCGLGAAWRLAELEHEDWVLCERNDHWGGLSASFQDEGGFWWDLGGHVLFSHYHYFDQVMDSLLGREDGWVFHEREAWIRMQDRFIPYPLQNNIHRLPRDVYWECLEGIIDITKNGLDIVPANFGEWIEATFGRGLAKWFLMPYNFKVWGYPVDQMDWSWVGERVASVDIKDILRNAVFDEDDKSWGPNALFRFPLHGGTGGIWRTLAEKLPQDRIHMNRGATSLSVHDRRVTFTDGTAEDYDVLLSTIPLTDLVRIADMEPPFELEPPLKYSATHIIGLALKGGPPDNLATKCWIYFPEDNCPFYRVTVFSNYSPNNVPDIENQWSLMCEVSESPVKRLDRDRLVEDVIDGGLHAGLLSDRREVEHTWHGFVEKGYPTPSLDRNSLVFPLLGRLEDASIYSRGRFGAWRYEVGNMDHSFMQGVESINRILASGEELTLWYPQIVNSMHPSGRKR
ncbi:MAG: FAD-dependent oxidoreductase [Thermodesulfobacteriota bacterium]|nr:FAD-dependent oxidoreductase [Thermodesulfobacteriota bacterium]